MNTNENLNYQTSRKVVTNVDTNLLSKNNNYKDSILQKTFSITYALLLTTAVITIVEALRTPNAKIRHILNLETCISCVAGYFYSIFIVQASEKNKDWSTITQTRYIDWSITTPMMLLALCLVLSMNSETVIHLKVILSIVILNYVMLLFGYLGEIKMIRRIIATILGFIAFLLMYYIIFINFVKPKYSKANYILFGMYFIVWSLYGVVYLFDEEYKNMITNILDLTAKCLIGLSLWVYYTNIIHW
jgi:bacteriorhodopsin